MQWVGEPRSGHGTVVGTLDRVPFDTTDEALEVQRAVWRRVGAEARVRIAFELSEAARRVALAGIAARHPELDATEHVAILVERLHGPHVARPGR